MATAADSFVILARQLAAHNNYQNAFEMYMCAFDTFPFTKQLYETEFCEVLTNLNAELAAVNNKSDIFANFERAITVFPESANILNDIGKYRYKYGYFSEALCYFEKALNLNLNNVNIEKNLNHAKRALFPRSKFRVLNDKIRNDAYRRAIQSCVIPNSDSVIDINAGTGLLALYANACRPIATTACESSTTMAKLAECVMQNNNAEKVVIINNSFLILGSVDIYGTRSVLLADLIDSALFGEYILTSLSHAWENLLFRGFKVIPGRAEYFIVGVKCDQLIKNYQLCEDAKRTLNIPHTNVHTSTYYAKTYCGEDVRLYEGLKYMCKPQTLFKIEFNNYYDVQEKLSRQEPYNAKLTATEDGEINAIIGYFDLHLTEDIKISSDPRCEWRANAWQQAVFFDLLPKKVDKNETLTIPFRTYGGRVTSLPEVNTKITKISAEAIKFLNDTEYMKMIERCLGVVCIYFGQTMDISYVDMVDLSPFPMFGVLMMKRGANSLVCYAKTEKDKTFIKTVLQANNIEVNRVTILVDQYWSTEMLEEKKIHIIFSNILDLNGDIDIKKKQTVYYLKGVHLVEGGLILPVKTTIMAQLVSSKWLEINNRVIDENVDDYKMAEYVNRYQVSQATYVDISRLEYTPLSDEFLVANCCDDMKSDLIKVNVETDGECNAILCWYNIQMLDDWSYISTKRANSFVNSTAFLNSGNEQVFRGDEVNVLKCVDTYGYFKLMMDVDHID